MGGEMESIRYQDRRVADEQIERLTLECKRNVAAWNGLRKYGNLQWWRELRYHNFLGTWIESNGRYLGCTCGLDVLESDIESTSIPKSERPKEIVELDLSDLVCVRFHVDFSDNPQPVTALIVSSIYDETLTTYLWTAFCQTCLAVVIDVIHENALQFVDSHNQEHLA